MGSRRVRMTSIGFFIELWKNEIKSINGEKLIQQTKKIQKLLDNIFNLQLQIITIVIAMNQTQGNISLEKKYFQSLVGSSSVKQTTASQFINECITKVESDLENGNVNISKKRNIQLELQDKRKEKYKKEMQIINDELIKNQEMYRKVKHQLVKQKKVETEEEKILQEAKKKDIEEKIKKWTELQQELKDRREHLEQVKKQKEIQEEERSKKEEQERIQFHKKQKKKEIEQRLQQIEENRERREELLKQSSIQIKHLNPKYLEIERKFKQYEEQIKFEEQILKKNHKLSLKIDHQAIKNHQKIFLQRLSSRKVHQKSCDSPKSSRSNDKKEGFNSFFSKDEEKTKLQKEKAKRRKQYQQKLKEIPVLIDQSKKVRVEIERDKGKNKKKYHFLGQKALNDFQIYGQFQDFEINVDHKQIGKAYLKELPSINQSSRIEKSRSLGNLPAKEVSQKIKYIDYLKELKTRRTEQGNRTEEEIKMILKTHKEKERVFSELRERGRRYDEQVRLKGQQIDKSVSIRGALKKNKEVDDMYLKSIKTKLACLQMKI